MSSCSALLESSLTQFIEFSLLDSTQISNPPPGLMVRLRLATVRFSRFCLRVAREKPDAVLIFLSSGASLVEKGLMAWVARAHGVPVLLFPRAGRVIQTASRSIVVRAFVRILLRPASVLLCQSDVWRRFACTQLGIASSRTVVIENWTATPELLRIGARRNWAKPRGSPIRITFVGWVEQEKGVLDLLVACRLLSDSADFCLRVVGDGNGRAAAESFVHSNGIAGRVRFLGWVQGASLHAILEDSDIFVLPSWAEGLPNAMIEAMACRLPVVVTRVGGIPDVIDDGVTGFLVNPRSPEELAGVLHRIIESAEIRNAVADAGFEVAESRFSRSVAVEKFRRAFTIALGRQI